MFNNDQEILEGIHLLLDFDNSSETAIMYGISEVDGELSFKIISENGDVYDLISSVNEDKLQMNYDYVTVKTTGWAAPLNEDGETDGLPSMHPGRRRVRLFVTADVKNKRPIGSSLKFADDPKNPIYDFNQATGSLADAIVSLVD